MDEKQLDRLDAWFRSVLWEVEVPCPEADYGTIDVHRLKGRSIRDDGKTFLIQGVREVFEIFEDPSNRSETLVGKLVLIGRGLRGVDLKDSIEWYVLKGDDH